MSKHDSPLRKTILHLLLITAIGLIAYSNTFNSPFVFDDLIQITKNPVIKDLNDFVLLVRGGDVGSSKGYEFNSRRWVGYLTFALNYRIGGLNVSGYHVVNLVIHLTNAVLLYFLVLVTFRTPFFSKRDAVNGKQQSSSQAVEGSSNDLITRQPHFSPSYFTINYSRFFALVVALLFVSHPIETQAVTYIVQRFTSLATMFYLLSVVIYIKARLASRQAGRLTSYVLSFLFAVLAMKTKEIAFTLPIMILLYEFTFFSASLKKKLLFLVPVLMTLVIIPLSMLHTSMTPGDLLSDLSEKTRVGAAIPRWDYFITQINVIATYIRLLIVPAGQNLDYDYPIYHSLFTPSVLFSFLFLSTIFGIAVYLLYKSQKAANDRLSTISKQRSAAAATGHESGHDDSRFRIHNSRGSDYSPFTVDFSRLAAFGILWFFITLSVESSIIPIADVMFEHRLYLPSAGAFIAIASGLFWLIGKLAGTKHPAEKITMAALGVIILALTITTFARNNIWKDETTLWQDVVSKSPGKARPIVNLGLAYSKANRLDEAELLLKKGMDLAPDTEGNFINLSSLYNKRQRFQLAEEYAHKALKINPESWEAYANLCTSYIGLQQYDQAIDACRNSMRINRTSAEAYNNLSMSYRKLGRYNEAAEAAQRAIAFAPESAEPYNNLGLVYVQIKRFSEAGSAFRDALRVDPGYLEAYNNLGGVYLATGDFRAAKEVFQNALKIDPNYTKGHYHLGLIYAMEGDKENAMKVYASLKDKAPEAAERLLAFIRAR